MSKLEIKKKSTREVAIECLKEMLRMAESTDEVLSYVFFFVEEDQTAKVMLGGERHYSLNTIGGVADLLLDPDQYPQLISNPEITLH